MENDANQESTYEPLEGRRRIESNDSLDVEESPQDRNGILYVALLAAGIGFVLPYNRYNFMKKKKQMSIQFVSFDHNFDHFYSRFNSFQLHNGIGLLAGTVSRPIRCIRYVNDIYHRCICYCANE